MDHDTQPRDALSLRIFRKTDEPEAALPCVTSLNELQREAQALRKENATLQRTLRLSSGLRQRFEMLFDTFPLGLITHDADDRILEANLTLAHMLQIERSQLIGQHIGNLVAPQDHAQFIQHLTQLRNSEATSTDVAPCTLHLLTQQQEPLPVQLESTLQHPGGAYAPGIIQTRVSPLEENNICEHPERFPEISDELQDQLQKEISGRKLAEEQSRQYQQRLAHMDRLNSMGEMASGLAHEINQPLTAISSYVQSCLRLLNNNPDRQTPDQQIKLPYILKQVNTQTQRATSIIQHLRDFVSASTTHRETTELEKIVRLATAMMRNEFIKHDIELKIIPHSNLLLIKADAIQIEQVVLNLLRNATDAMSEMASGERYLRITLDAPSITHVRVAIGDSGPGIKADTREKIAKPFFSTKPNGMGLGLTISRIIVEDHGGELTHEANPAGGETFTFTLARNGQRQDDKQQPPTPTQ